MTPAASPVSLRRGLDTDELLQRHHCEAVHILGSFWPYPRSGFESHVVKSFKECNPITGFQPHISALCEFYAGQLARVAGGTGFDWVARVLSSAEQEPEAMRPQSLLADTLCKRIGARNCTHVFFKSESRPAMRFVGRLSGRDALKPRIQYVTQDLFIRPCDLGGSVLLVDDIYNTGASMRVYAAALRKHAGVERVVGVNLAATRFNRGRDGHGILKLDTSGLEASPGLARVTLDADGVRHCSDVCPSIKRPASPEMLFVAERQSSPCPSCCAQAVAERKWWQVFR